MRDFSFRPAMNRVWMGFLPPALALQSARKGPPGGWRLSHDVPGLSETLDPSAGLPTLPEGWGLYGWNEMGMNYCKGPFC